MTKTYNDIDAVTRLLEEVGVLSVSYYSMQREAALNCFDHGNK